MVEMLFGFVAKWGFWKLDTIIHSNWLEQNCYLHCQSHKDENIILSVLEMVPLTSSSDKFQPRCGREVESKLNPVNSSSLGQITSIAFAPLHQPLSSKVPYISPSSSILNSLIAEIPILKLTVHLLHHAITGTPLVIPDFTPFTPFKSFILLTSFTLTLT